MPWHISRSTYDATARSSKNSKRPPSPEAPRLAQKVHHTPQLSLKTSQAAHAWFRIARSIQFKYVGKIWAMAVHNCAGSSSSKSRFTRVLTTAWENSTTPTLCRKWKWKFKLPIGLVQRSEREAWPGDSTSDILRLIQCSAEIAGVLEITCRHKRRIALTKNRLVLSLHLAVQPSFVLEALSSLTVSFSKQS